MSKLPPWVDRLREDPALAAILPLQWLDDEQSTAIREGWLQTWDQVPYEEPFHAACRSRLERCQPLAIGPSRARRLSGQEANLVLVFDPEQPERPWASLSQAMPSVLWARGEPEAQALMEALQPYLVEEAQAVAALPGRWRGVKELGIESREVVENAIEHLELWMDDATWGSAHAEDWWLGREVRRGMMTQMIDAREAREEHGGRFPSLSWRSLWSKGVMRLEQHPYGAWVFELQYTPAKDAAVIEALGEHLGFRLPLDLPVDLVASLLRGGAVGHAELAASREKNGELFDELRYLCALAPAEPSTAEALLSWAGRDLDPDSMQLLVNLAASYGFTGVLFQVAATTEDPDLRAALHGFLAPQPLAEEGE